MFGRLLTGARPRQHRGRVRMQQPTAHLLNELNPEARRGIFFGGLLEARPIARTQPQNRSNRKPSVDSAATCCCICLSARRPPPATDSGPAHSQTKSSALVSDALGSLAQKFGCDWAWSGRYDRLVHRPSPRHSISRFAWTQSK
jgi:hypothetical protein